MKIPPQIQAGEKITSPEVDNFITANTNKIATTIRTKFPAWYTKHYGKPSEEKLYKRMLGALLDEELVQEYSKLGVDLRSIELMINEGLKRFARECKIPPTHQEFIELCLRIDNLPDFETAWKEAVEFQGKKSHPVINAAANAVGVFELKHSSLDNVSLKNRFKTQLAIKSRLFRAGKPLSEHVYLLGSDGNKKTVAELAELSWTEHEKKVQARIVEQGISNNPQEARLQCLAALGLKPRVKCSE